MKLFHVCITSTGPDLAGGTRARAPPPPASLQVTISSRLFFIFQGGVMHW